MCLIFSNAASVVVSNDAFSAGTADLGGTVSQRRSGVSLHATAMTNWMREEMGRQRSVLQEGMG